ncbi:S8 family peptidase [Bradyrhizobium sp. 930_D9_N1_4]|uniref:S8 family peptidase n=1 Tax=Bradyrhizobium sp. 930_D9_N1_4 TaxID=3240374 RepID=UPI003F8BFA0C
MAGSSIEDTLAAIGYVKVIVTMQNRATAAAAPKAQTESAMEGHFLPPDTDQVESLSLAATRATGRKIRRPESLSARRVRVYPHLGLAVGTVDAGGFASLQADPSVGMVAKAPEISLIKPVAAQPIKTGIGPTWGIKRLKVDRLWQSGFTGKGVLVGHLDTGVDGAHPALKGAIGRFAEFDLAGDEVPNAKPWDSGSHGTHTAGTIAGRPVVKGKFGVAPDAQLASAMVIEGGQVIERILAGMDWVVGSGCRILSMSLGLRGFTPAFQAVIDSLRAANVLPVIAAGNEGALTSRSPGNYANVLSIGAMDVKNKVADFSSSQRFNRPINPLCPALAGPGVAITSCVPGNLYETMDGTSMATPHIAGLAALLLQARPDATANQLEQAIVGSCTLPASMQEARANHGVPDALKAFELLTGSQLPAAIAGSAPRRATPKRGRASPKRSSPRPGRGASKKAGRKAKVAAARRSTPKKTSPPRR